MKCPRCRTGDMFTVMNPYRLNHLSQMPERCPCCNQSNFPETGFYFGAMYVSYMFSVALSVAVTLLIWLLIGFNTTFIIIADAVLLLGTLPLLYRYARVLWLYAAVRFDQNAWKQANESSTA